MRIDVAGNATRTSYENITNRILSPVHITCSGITIETVALWDTGATCSCVSKTVEKELCLVPVSITNINTPSGCACKNVFIVDISLPNNTKISNRMVVESEIGNQGIGMLIGMDIIQLGDFAITNANGKTVFSFRIPAVGGIDFVKEYKIQQLIGPKHGTTSKKKKK